MWSTGDKDFPISLSVKRQKVYQVILLLGNSDWGSNYFWPCLNLYLPQIQLLDCDYGVADYPGGVKSSIRMRMGAGYEESIRRTRESVILVKGCVGYGINNECLL